jgi:hypothetical protein
MIESLINCTFLGYSSNFGENFEIEKLLRMFLVYETTKSLFQLIFLKKNKNPTFKKWNEFKKRCF